MTESRYTAWRFVHPLFDRVTPRPGLRVDAKGHIELVQDNAAVRQAILLLLSTRPGERVMRPAYGCDLQRLLFSPNDDTTAGLAIHYVRQALTRWEPGIEILRLDAGANPDDPARLDIVLQYRLKGLQQVQQLTYPVNLQGEQA